MNWKSWIFFFFFKFRYCLAYWFPLIDLTYVVLEISRLPPLCKYFPLCTKEMRGSNPLIPISYLLEISFWGISFLYKICSKFTCLNFLIQNLMCFILKSWFLCWPDAPSISGCENSWLRQRQHSVACWIRFSHKITENKQPPSLSQQV